MFQLLEAHVIRDLRQLDQSWDVVGRRQLEQQMHVIGHNADFDDAGAMSLRLAEEKRQQKLGDRLVDER